MFCKNCGQEIKEDGVFCTSCGYKLDGSQQFSATPLNNEKKIRLSTALCLEKFNLFGMKNL